MTSSQEFTEGTSSSNDINIHEILIKTMKGKDILKKYKTNNCLDEPDQTSIARIIVDHLTFHDIKMEPKLMKKVTDGIAQLFPTENVLTYYSPRCGKRRNPSGKIYDRYYNAMYKRKRSAVSSGTSVKAKNKHNDESSADVLHKNDEYQTKKQWLFKNNPQNITVLWKETSEYRMRERLDFAKMLEEWPRYKDPNFPELINIDFETLYQGKENMLFQKMDGFENQFNEAFFTSRIKDKLNLQYLKTMYSTELPLGMY